jgi:ATP-dependent Lon protease
VIELSGYTIPEKVGIARKFLLPRQIEANGLEGKQLTVSDGALAQIIQVIHVS